MEIVKREIERVQFYACTDPAWAGARHGFSTRLGGVSPAPWSNLNLGANRGDGELRPVLRRSGDRRQRPGKKPSGPRKSGSFGYPGGCDGPPRGLRHL